jgi:xanthine dehydrogenase accessory factor
MQDIYQKIAGSQRKGLEVALCIITNTKGSTPRQAGAKMLVYADGKIYGTIGGGDLEKNVTKNALAVLESKTAATFKHDLLHEHNMCCGGSVEVYIEPVLKKNKLYIFGAGHTGHALAKSAVNLNFEVVVIDDRKEYIDEIKEEGINKLNLHYEQALPLLPFDESTFITIMTYSHPYDRDILAYCLNKPFAYLGMIGSRRKVEMTKKMFAQAGIGTLEELEKIDMPMGLDIGAETPEEIAISILAKLVAVRKRISISTI